MSGGGDRVEEYATSVVRLFPDRAGSVVWFVGPVAYEDTALDERLVADLRAWEAAHEEGLTPEHGWRSGGLAAEHDRAWARLARRLADQIGDEFEVEHHRGEARRRVRGAGPARNPAAAAAFHGMAERERRERALARGFD